MRNFGISATMPVDQFAGNRAVDEDARTGGADLALVHEGPQHDALGGGVHIGVGIDDLCILAAQLKRDFLQAPGGVCHDDPARRGRSGQRNLADIGMGDQRPAGGFARPTDHVHHAGRQNFTDQRGQFQGRERRRLRRLVDHRVADRDGRRDLAGEHVEREIPRPHDADDAQAARGNPCSQYACRPAAYDLRRRARRRRNSGAGRPPCGRWRRSRATACRCRSSRARRSARCPRPAGRRSSASCRSACGRSGPDHCANAALAAMTAVATSTSSASGTVHSNSPVSGERLSSTASPFGATQSLPI